MLDPDGSDSAKLDNAVELLVRGGRDIRHAVAMLVPRRGSPGRDLDRRGPARLLPLPRLPDRAVGRPGRPGLHRRPPGRRRPRPQRPAAAALRDARTASSSAPRRPARSTSPATAGCGGAGSGPARCSASTPSGGCSPTTRSRASWPPPALDAPGWPSDLRSVDAGRPVEPPADDRRRRRRPGRLRLHQRSWYHGAAADGHRRQGADVLDGRRHAPAAVARADRPAGRTTSCASASPRSPTRPSTTCASAM